MQVLVDARRFQLIPPQIASGQNGVHGREGSAIQIDVLAASIGARVLEQAFIGDGLHIGLYGRVVIQGIDVLASGQSTSVLVFGHSSGHL